MKKAILFLLLLPLTLMAQNCLDDCDKPLIAKEWSKWTMDVRVAYFHPCSKQTTKIFSNAWIDYEVEVTRNLRPNLQLWLGVDWTNKKGHLPKKPYGYHNSTRISIAPIHAGFKAIFPLTCKLDAYIGGGICVSFLKLKNHSDFFRAKLGSAPYDKFVTKNNVGAITKVGLRYVNGKCTFLDLFADYYCAPDFKFGRHHFPNRYLDVSGYKLGLGLGVFF
jgi:hypothetical protein